MGAVIINIVCIAQNIRKSFMDSSSEEKVQVNIHNSLHKNR